ncbi:MAG: zinc metalloprotease HtpX [Planctomycetota bacterium]
MTRFVNNTKTAILLGGMFGLILAAGYVFGQGSGLIIAFILGGAMNIVAFFFSDKIALKAMRGKEVDEQTAPDLIEMVARLARNADLPMPRVYICPQQAPNAFATGRSPRKAAVAVTEGALQMLSYDELEGVMAHELAHVKNRDTLTSTVAATIAGAISALGWVFMFGGRDRDVHPLIALGFVILAPIAAGIIQMAISRSREYVADHDGAMIAGTPDGLISALQKLEMQAQRIPLQHQNPAQNHMFIVQPLNAASGGRGGGLGNLFRTHPQTADRIAKLREMIPGRMAR